MTRRMKAFLFEAAQAEPGKGIPIRPWDKHIAAKATRDGYGWMISAPARVFIIEQAGRDALKAA